MNKRVLNSVLILVLVVVWGVVIYKFFASSVNTVESPGHGNVFDNEIVITTRDTFQPPSFLRDPFLDKYTVTKQPAPKITPKKHIVKKNNAPWPDIRYLGFVQGEHHQNPLVILSIDNTIARLRKGEKTSGLTVKKIEKNTILVKKGTEERVFVKE